MKIEQPPVFEEENELKEIADSFNLGVEVPRVGTPAYERLKNICELYTGAVVNHQHANVSPALLMNEKAKTNSEKNRRSIHNQLCVMLLGTTWHETSSEARRRVSNFAVTVGGREDFVGSL